MPFIKEDLSGLSYIELSELVDELTASAGEVSPDERGDFDAYCREVMAARTAKSPVATPQAVDPKMQRGDYWPKEVGRRRAAKELALKKLRLEQDEERLQVQHNAERALAEASAIEKEAGRVHAEALHKLDMRVLELETEHDALILEAQQNL